MASPNSSGGPAKGKSNLHTNILGRGGDDFSEQLPSNNDRSNNATPVLSVNGKPRSPLIGENNATGSATTSRINDRCDTEIALDDNTVETPLAMTGGQASNIKGSRWWGRQRGGWGSSEANNSNFTTTAADGNDQYPTPSSAYTSMEAPLEDGRYTTTTTMLHASSSSSTNATIGTTASLSSKHTTTTIGAPRYMAAKTTKTTTREDQLRQDCSFFYQGMDEDFSSPRDVSNGGAGGTTTTARDFLRRPLSMGLDGTGSASNGGSSNTHHNSRRVLSGRAGIIFMNKYERLNQVIDIGNGDDDSDSDRPDRSLMSGLRNDLFLDEEIGTDGIDFTTAAAGPSANLALQSNSDLIFEQNGRVLMRLPRDQVRLLMDHDLDPGILSVEQWRTTPTTTGGPTLPVPPSLQPPVPIDPLETHGGGQIPASATMAVAAKDSTARSNPDLYYVLTVPDDLYRRVVSEMSYAAHPPCWGFFKCCSAENEKADIKLALLIIFVVLLLMFIGSMEWPTE